MNRYGRQAQQHWAMWRPNELSQIEDPDAHFTELGETVQTQIEAVTTALAGDDPGGETDLAKQARLETAKFHAEEQVLRELVLLPPEPGHPDADPEDAENPLDAGRIRDEDGNLMEPGVIGVTPWMPMIMTPDHPNYHDLEDTPGVVLHQVSQDDQRPPDPS